MKKTINIKKTVSLNNRIRVLVFAFVAIISLASCHESLEKRAAREAKEYTKRNCPTPEVNFTRTDSVAFDIEKREYTYYCSFVNQFDNEDFINKKRNEIHDGLKELLFSNAGMKVYVDAGFSFTYIVRSGSNPEKILYKDTFHTK